MLSSLRFIEALDILDEIYDKYGRYCQNCGSKMEAWADSFDPYLKCNVCGELVYKSAKVPGLIKYQKEANNEECRYSYM